MKIKSIALAFITIICFSQCGSSLKTTSRDPLYTAPEWSANSVIYEVNIRQHSPEGTLQAFTKDIDRIKNLGADILWIMPVQPIGIKNRKGGLGSYYSIKNYVEINPEFGNLADFKNLVETAHKNGLKVIIDWVANHTAWDHPWITEHPNWYVQDSTGKIVTQYDWTDVAKLNYANKDMRKEMIASLKHWVKEYDIDGFRCDVAFLVPADFWKDVRTELEKIKPVFMLAEMEMHNDINPKPEEYFQNAFNANYAWNFHGTAHDVAQGKKTYQDFLLNLNKNIEQVPGDVFKMHFLTNHDENSWNGTVKEKFNTQWKKWSVLCYTLEQSFPLIYSGEEANNTKRLAFFEKDPIKWGDTSLYSWYRKMNHLKHTQPCLGNGSFGAPMEIIVLPNNPDVLAFKRTLSGKSVYVLVNMSATSQSINQLERYRPKSNEVYVSDQMEITENSIELGKDGFAIFTPNF